MSMNKTCAISSWISFLISADIKHSEKEVAQRENHPWTAERRAQLEFYIATGPREERFSDSFFTIALDLNPRRCPSPYWLNRMHRIEASASRFASKRQWKSPRDYCESSLDYPGKLSLRRSKYRGRKRRILPLEPKFHVPDIHSSTSSRSLPSFSSCD